MTNLVIYFHGLRKAFVTLDSCYIDVTSDVTSFLFSNFFNQPTRFHQTVGARKQEWHLAPRGLNKETALAHCIERLQQERTWRSILNRCGKKTGLVLNTERLEQGNKNGV